VGTGPGQLNATNGTTKDKCGGDYGVGWGIAWNDATDPGYAISYKYKGTSYSLNVGSLTGPIPTSSATTPPAIRAAPTAPLPSPVRGRPRTPTLPARRSRRRSAW